MFRSKFGRFNVDVFFSEEVNQLMRYNNRLFRCENEPRFLRWDIKSDRPRNRAELCQFAHALQWMSPAIPNFA